jgi:hypothetical protein
MQLIFTINSPQEEFERVSKTIEMLPWFIENYGSANIAKLPDDKMQQAVKTGDLLVFKDSCYDAEQLNNFSTYVQNEWDSFLRKVNVEYLFKTFNKNWGFKIFREYSVHLTQYGTGGSYNPNGSIIMRIGGHPSPGSCLFHEMIHIGIEENIIQKYGINQMDKEKIVDNICRLYIDNYRLPSIDGNCDLKLNKEGVENNFDKLIKSNFLKSK